MQPVRPFLKIKIPNEEDGTLTGKRKPLFDNNTDNKVRLLNPGKILDETHKQYSSQELKRIVFMNSKKASLTPK